VASVWTQIREEVFARLQNITKANGYSTDIACIEKGRVSPFNDDDLPAINFWKTDDVSEAKLYTRDQRTLRMGFEFYTLSNDDDIDTLSDEFMADLFISLYRDPNAPLVTDDPLPMFATKQFITNFSLMRPIISQGSKPRIGVFAILSFTYTINNLQPNILI
jgi:hypothetical protein